MDPVRGIPHTIWHEDLRLEKVMRDIIERANPDRWVETGTHMGWTSLWVAETAPHLPIYTVEVDSTYFQHSAENLENYPQVSIRQGHSPEFLQRLMPLLKTGVSLFWLDAHWYPPVPLRDECRVISQLDKYICVIDDFFCWEPYFHGDTFFSIYPASGEATLNSLAYVADILGTECYRPSYQQGVGGKGYGIFIKGIPFTPDPELTKLETLSIAEIQERENLYLKENVVR